MIARKHIIQTCTSSLWPELDFLEILFPKVELILEKDDINTSRTLSETEVFFYKSRCNLQTIYWSVTSVEHIDCSYPIKRWSELLPYSQRTSCSAHPIWWVGSAGTLGQVFHWPIWWFCSVWKGAAIFKTLQFKPTQFGQHGKSSSTVIKYFISKSVIPSFRYSRGITLCMGQVFHQNIQTFVLLIEELLGPPKVHGKLKRKNNSVYQLTVGILIALLNECMWSTCRYGKGLQAWLSLELKEYHEWIYVSG